MLSAVAAVSDTSDKWSREAFEVLFRSGAIHPDSIMPEYDRLDLDLLGPRLNMLILLELLYRSERGLSLTVGLPDFIRETSKAVQAGAPFR